MERFKNNSFVIFVILLLFIFLTAYWLYQATYYTKQAQKPGVAISTDNSYVFTNPQKALANTEEKIRIIVFVLNDQGLGVAERKTILSADKNLIINNVQSVTDKYGKAVFDIASKSKGDFSIDVYVDGKLLPNNANLVFY